MNEIETAPVTEIFSGAHKRDRILRAAVEVFARTGYFNSRVSEVAKAAGVADGTIYLYFLGKEDLLVTIFREHTRLFLEAVQEEIKGCNDPTEKLRRIVRFHLRSLGADRPLAIVFQVELRQSLKFMSLFSQQEVADYLNLLRRIIEQGQSAGLFRSSFHPQLAAKAIFGILDEMVTSWILSEKHYELRDQADQVNDLILGGLQSLR
ncbi:MAG TPA: TetR/AcrR family transcriptional regulator [Thermoanaerobaculia bacterium]|nr:TetR/AcrR family transcriptional regulator [Thermoanaerobaculia bacterium]